MTQLKVSKLGAPGFLADTAESIVEPQAFTEVKNARFGASGVRTVGGERVVMTEASISPLWLKMFPPLNAPLWVYANNTAVWVFDGVHTNITRLAGAYTGVPEERWQGEVLNEIGFFNNVKDIPQAWIGPSPAVKLVNLANWPSTLRCRALRPHGNFLFALYTIESGTVRKFRVRWSDAAEPGTIPSSWALNDPTKLSGEFDLADTSDEVVDGKTLGQNFIVYKQKSAYSLSFIFPSSNDVWARFRLFDQGVLWRDCVQEFPGGHFVVGLDDIYTHNGGQNANKSIVESKLRDWIFNQIDSSNYFNCFTFRYSKNELAFAFPEAGHMYPNIAVIWNWVTGGWGVRDLPDAPFISEGQLLISPEDELWG